MAVRQRGHQSVPGAHSSRALDEVGELTAYFDRPSLWSVTIPKNGQANSTYDDANTNAFMYGGTWGVGAAASQVSPETT